LTAQSFLRTIGTGFSKYFYYDDRIYVGPGYFRSHSTVFEYDDSIRTKGVALGVLSALFDGSRGLGQLSSDPNTTLFLFDRQGTPMAAIWSNDGSNRSLVAALTGLQVRLYDLMGNSIPFVGGVIPYGASPVYIEGFGISATLLRTALELGISTPRGDTTAPNLAMAEWPTGPTRQNPIRFRWLALDETSLPSSGDPNAITYSYRLEGRDADWSAWTPRSYVSYANLADGQYTFHVRARDG